MPRILQMMKLHKLMAPADGEGGDLGGDDAAVAAAAALAAKAIADAADAEAVRLAAADKGKLSDSEAKLLKDAMKQKTRATELEAELAKAKETLKSFEGIDVVAARKALIDREETERLRSIKEGDFDRLTKQMAERHLAEKTQLEQNAETAVLSNSVLQKQIADLTVGNAFSTSKFVGEDLTLTPSKARVIYGSHFEFSEGKIVGYDKPVGASDRTILVNSSGTSLSFEDALRKIIEADPDKDHLIRSKVKSGTNSTTTKGGKQVDDQRKSQLSGVEKIAAGLQSLASKS